MFIKKRFSLIEILTLTFTSCLVSCGIIAAQIDVNWFENVYAVEDGFVENWTLVPLLIAAFYAIYLYIKLNKSRPKIFKTMMLLIAAFCVFVAGEEISWGQRIFKVESSSFFIENNAQGETNLHNMTVRGKKVNKIVFSQLLSVCIGIYLIVLPVLHMRSKQIRTFLNSSGIPVPQIYQIVSCLVLLLAITLIPSGKNAEILEAGITSMFMLIFLFPKNIEAFTVAERRLKVLKVKES